MIDSPLIRSRLSPRRGLVVGQFLGLSDSCDTDICRGGTLDVAETFKGPRGSPNLPRIQNAFGVKELLDPFHQFERGTVLLLDIFAAAEANAMLT